MQVYIETVAWGNGRIRPLSATTISICRSVSKAGGRALVLDTELAESISGWEGA